MLVGLQGANLNGEFSDLHHVTGVQGRGPIDRQPLTIQHGSVGRAEIFDQPALPAPGQSGMLARDIAIIQDDVVGLTPSQLENWLPNRQLILPSPSYLNP